MRTSYWGMDCWDEHTLCAQNFNIFPSVPKLIVTQSREYRNKKKEGIEMIMSIFVFF